MSNRFIAVPGVHITIEGLVALFFRWNDAGQIVGCSMGVVADAPAPHEFSLEVKKNNSPVTVGTVLDELRLDVQNVSQTGIRLTDPNANIDRLTGTGNPQSFRWVLDFEGSELYTRPIGANPRKLRPILRIEHGEIRTEEISVNHLVYRPKNQPNAQWTLIGKVATRVAVFINLDQENSEALFFNGDFPVEGTRTVRGEVLEILMKMSHPESESPRRPHPEDADHYHLALGQGLGAEELKKFNATPFEPSDGPISPEASCLVGRMGTTEL